MNDWTDGWIDSCLICNETLVISWYFSQQHEFNLHTSFEIFWFKSFYVYSICLKPIERV